MEEEKLHSLEWRFNPIPFSSGRFMITLILGGDFLGRTILRAQRYATALYSGYGGGISSSQFMQRQQIYPADKAAVYDCKSYQLESPNILILDDSSSALNY